MAKLNEPLYKNLTASGAVTTNNKAGRLHKVSISCDTDNNKVDILDGATNVFSFYANSSNTPIEFELPNGLSPVFTTDIDCVISGSNISATFIYEEIQS